MDVSSPDDELLPPTSSSHDSEVTNMPVPVEQPDSRPQMIRLLSSISEQDVVEVEERERIHRLARKLQQEDPYLLYLGEDAQVYRILTGDQLTWVTRKYRLSYAPFSASWSALLRLTYIGLCLGTIGLLFSGLGTLVCAPLAGLAALALNLKAPPGTLRVHSLVLVMVAGGLWLVGLLLSAIFFLHLV